MTANIPMWQPLLGVLVSHTPYLGMRRSEARPLLRRFLKAEPLPVQCEGGKSHPNKMGHHGALWPYSPASTLLGKAQPHPLNLSPNFDASDNPVQCCSVLSMGLAQTSHWGLWDACWRMLGIPSTRSKLGGLHRTPIAVPQGEAASGAIPRCPPLPPTTPTPSVVLWLLGERALTNQ